MLYYFNLKLTFLSYKLILPAMLLFTSSGKDHDKLTCPLPILRYENNSGCRDSIFWFKELSKNLIN